MSICFTPVRGAIVRLSAWPIYRGQKLTPEKYATETMVMFSGEYSDGKMMSYQATAADMAEFHRRDYYSPFIGCVLSRDDAVRLSTWAKRHI